MHLKSILAYIYNLIYPKKQISMMPAARISDFHVCPLLTPGVPPIPHVGGPILPPGKPTVLIGGLPAATITSMCTCVGPPDVIVKGSMGVLIMSMPAARIGDTTAHGGTIISGCFNVLIGEIGMPNPGAALAAVDMGALADMASSAAAATADAAASAVDAASGIADSIDNLQDEIDAMIDGDATAQEIADKQADLAALQGI